MKCPICGYDTAKPHKLYPYLFRPFKIAFCESVCAWCHAWWRSVEAASAVPR